MVKLHGTVRPILAVIILSTTNTGWYRAEPPVIRVADLDFSNGAESGFPKVQIRIRAKTGRNQTATDIRESQSSGYIDSKTSVYVDPGSGFFILNGRIWMFEFDLDPIQLEKKIFTRL